MFQKEIQVKKPNIFNFEDKFNLKDFDLTKHLQPTFENATNQIQPEKAETSLEPKPLMKDIILKKEPSGLISKKSLVFDLMNN